ELLFVPERGAITLRTELGPLAVAPGEIAVVPRGIRFAVELPGGNEGPARGYLCENFGAAFTLPERGPIGANGLANERDFLAPSAAYQDRAATAQVVQKFGGNLWAADYDHSPLDVVGWHGNYAPYKYDTASFMVIGTISFDHPDPSIFTVLTSPSELAALVPPQHHVRVHGPGPRRLRRQGRRVRARRGEPAQHLRLARAGRRDLPAGQHRRAAAAEDRRHPGVHVREPLDARTDPAGPGGGPPSARLRRRVGRPDPVLPRLAWKALCTFPPISPPTTPPCTNC